MTQRKNQEMKIAIQQREIKKKEEMESKMPNKTQRRQM